MSYADVYYVATLIEFIGRETLNRRNTLAEKIGMNGLCDLLSLADVNHCLPMRQVADEVIEQYGINCGDYDTISDCRHRIPSCAAIGKVYARLVEDIAASPDQYPKILYSVFTSNITDAISDFSTSFYFAPRSEIAYYYNELNN